MEEFISIRTQGIEQVRRKLMRGAFATEHTTPALLLIRKDMFRIIRINFESQGRRGGGSWQQLEPETIERKLALGQDPRILIARGRLMGSFTNRESPYMRTRVTRSSIYINSTLPYADIQQYGDEAKGIAPRPFIRFLPNDRRRWAQVVRDHIVGEMRL